MNHSFSSYQSAPPKTNGFGIYLHVPYCRHRCSYCDFFSDTESPEFERFSEKIVGEIGQSGPWWQGLARSTAVDTVFFGGGTPSLLPELARSKILDTIRQSFKWNSSVEVTLETNPENVTPEFIAGLLPSGINRLSLGVQSFQPHFLDALDRKCRPDTVFKAVKLIQESGFENWSLDFIMGIPGQRVDDLRRDLEQAVGLNPTHMSVYSLTLKPGHVLYKHLPNEDLSADLFEEASGFLKNAGYRQYEISNFAKPSFECRHNLIYWNGDDFLGLGPSAASRYFDGVFHHRKQVSDLGKYFSQKDVREIGFEITTREQSILEGAFLELRKDVGVDNTDFQKRYGYDLIKSPRFKDFESEGLITANDSSVRLTSKGRLLADSVTSGLVMG